MTTIKKFDILIEDLSAESKFVDTYFTVWCDADMKEVIEGVEGVTDVFNYISKTVMHVYVDARYDRDSIKNEIFLAVKEAMKKKNEFNSIQN